MLPVHPFGGFFGRWQYPDQRDGGARPQWTPAASASQPRDQNVRRRPARGHTKREAREMIEDALNVVGLRGQELLEKYPHQLSGGLRQRMMVARAFLLKPRLIVADEPVSMVDASLRAMILEIMLRMRDEYGISFVYITHDLSTAYQISDDTYILYQGSIAEKGATQAVVDNPRD